MRAILDTHVFLWWITGDARLSESAVSIITDLNNTIYFSAASGWEIAIKAKLGKLVLPGQGISLIGEQITAGGFTPLAVTIGHALHVFNLPGIHRDPFDRMLVAQAQLENMPIITSDPQIGAYQVKIVW